MYVYVHTKTSLDLVPCLLERTFLAESIYPVADFRAKLIIYDTVNGQCERAD